MLASMWVKTLKLNTFRNLATATLQLPGPGVYVLYGPNGAGKTNVLEALSLLSPGQGLHRDRLDSMTQHGASGWSLYAETVQGDETHRVGMQLAQGRRQLRLDGEDVSGQAQLAQVGAVVWFTPEMDRLFFDSPSARRRFLDRLVFGVMPTHAGALSRYTSHMQKRARLLKEHADPDWIALEEQQVADWGVRVARARLDFLEMLAPHLVEVALALSGSAEKLVLESADPVADFTAQLMANRARDQRYGSTHFGPHRSDVGGTLALPEGPAVALAQASMGQHKRAVLQMLIGHARLLKAATGHAPCLLLDEVAAHLDASSRALLYTQLAPLAAQLWLTGTERQQFEGLPEAHFIAARAGELQLEDV